VSTCVCVCVRARTCVRACVWLSVCVCLRTCSNTKARPTNHLGRKDGKHAPQEVQHCCPFLPPVALVSGGHQLAGQHTPPAPCSRSRALKDTRERAHARNLCGTRFCSLLRDIDLEPLLRISRSRSSKPTPSTIRTSTHRRPARWGAMTVAPRREAGSLAGTGNACDAARSAAKLAALRAAGTGTPCTSHQRRRGTCAGRGQQRRTKKVRGCRVRPSTCTHVKSARFVAIADTQTRTQGARAPKGACSMHCEPPCFCGGKNRDPSPGFSRGRIFVARQTSVYREAVVNRHEPLEPRRAGAA
jgi:hypothetical protein